jgi:malonyl CoA-acyl carrier protein transacylase
MNGLLFPGQGSQTVGMGKELYEKLPAASIALKCLKLQKQ